MLLDPLDQDYAQPGLWSCFQCSSEHTAAAVAVSTSQKQSEKHADGSMHYKLKRPVNLKANPLYSTVFTDPAVQMHVGICTVDHNLYRKITNKTMVTN